MLSEFSGLHPYFRHPEEKPENFLEGIGAELTRKTAPGSGDEDLGGLEGFLFPGR
jgi:hypothetical protein